MKIDSVFSKIRLNNGYEMPRYGMGPGYPEATDETVGAGDLTGRNSEVQTTEMTWQATMDALIECGVRSFDSGARYGTEGPLGEYFKACGIKREELYITTKVNNTMHGYDNTMRDFENSLRTTGLDYIDLYLIHCPVPIKGLYVETWKAFEKIYQSGLVKAIGVSNFTVKHFYELEDNSDIVPTVNQYEQHPFYVQPNLVAYERRHHIIPQSYSPLGQGRFANDHRIQWLADKYGKTVAQIILRWHLQMGFMVVTRSTNLSRIRQNTDIFDFELTPEDMAFMDTLNHLERVWHNPERFPGTAAHIAVEEAFRDTVDREVGRRNPKPKKVHEIYNALDALLAPADIDGTKDYIIYCFTKASAIHGRNGRIQEQAIEEAKKLAVQFVEEAIKE